MSEIVYKELIHKSCGKPAMLYEDREYKPSDPVLAKHFKHLDGREMKPQEKIICDSCWKIIARIYISNEGSLFAR